MKRMRRRRIRNSNRGSALLVSLMVMVGLSLLGLGFEGPTPRSPIRQGTRNRPWGARGRGQYRDSIQLPMLLGFGASQSSHLVGIGEYTTPWDKERLMALRLEDVIDTMAADGCG